MGENFLVEIFQNIMEFVQGDTGKTLSMLLVMGSGVALWMGVPFKKTAIGIIAGTFLVFSCSYVAKSILGLG